MLEFLNKHIPDMTSEWINKTYTSGNGVYAQPKDSEAYDQLRHMNKQFILALNNCIFGKETSLQEWSTSIASDRTRTATPLYDIIVNFSIFRSIYYSYIEKFIEGNSKEVSGNEVINWVRIISRKFDDTNS
ncbi:hypothetical protein KHA93_05330 [Bacillus sp. FJAT-49732]|uniref:Uncharacterized protein n=1 Tax=Lederbergia citrisecunda TaxID=2833583 RepID=A0A942TKX1_9BACI|nr:hypothetical protein [Lederbergia citrisecunda]MBS4199078.1 hypothetical protein [Lederbergia citrisecunda]